MGTSASPRRPNTHDKNSHCQVVDICSFVCSLFTLQTLTKCYYNPGHLLGKCVCMLCWLQLLATLWMSDVHNSLSSRALLSSCGLVPVVSFMELMHFIVGLPFFLLPSIFPTFIVFSKKPCLLLMQPKWNSISVVSFASSYISGLICSSFRWSRGFVELPCSTVFQMDPFFFNQPSSLLNFCICTVIENASVWMIFALVCNDTSLLLMIFLILSLLPFWVSPFCWFLGCSVLLNQWLNQSKQGNPCYSCQPL